MEQALAIAFGTGPSGQLIKEMNNEGLPLIDPATGKPDSTPSPVPEVSPPPADAIGYWVDCNGVTHDYWAIPSTVKPHPSPSLTTPKAIYDFVSATVTLPHLTVGVNPTAKGIAGLESYFWISGYQGTPVTASTPDGTFTVNIVATPVSYTWSFGDGSSLTTASLGLASTASPINHTYSVMSSRSPYAVGGNYLVGVTASFDTRFQVVGPGVDPTWQDFSSLNLP
ncbi:MAG TPA: hypothetical protein VKY26_00065, partial [Actinomycetota bacterium]|nr:hypothetical protein [Actinomycetota bacterium]